MRRLTSALSGVALRGAALGGAALALGLAASCAKDPVAVVFVDRLLDEASAWEGGGRLETAAIADQLQPAMRATSGAWLERQVSLPPQPCWLLYSVAAVASATLVGSTPDGGTGSTQDGVAGRNSVRHGLSLRVEVVAGGRTVVVAEERPRPLAGSPAGSASPGRIDLEAWAGQSVVLRFRGDVALGASADVGSARENSAQEEPLREGPGDWWLIRPRIETQEAFDSRYRTLVLLVVPGGELLRIAAQADAAPGLQKWNDHASWYERVRLPHADAQSNLRALLDGMARALRPSGRECFAYVSSSPQQFDLEGSAGFDLWYCADPYAPTDDAGGVRLVEQSLLRSLGRPSPQSLCLVVVTEARGAALDGALRRLQRQLESDALFERALVVMTSTDSAAGMEEARQTSALVKFPANDVRAPDSLPGRVSEPVELGELRALLVGPGSDG